MHRPNKGSILWIMAVLTSCVVLAMFYVKQDILRSYKFTVFQRDEILPLPSQNKSIYCGFPRILCMIFVTVGNWPKRGEAVQRTWSRHCYRRLFFYSRQNLNAIPDVMKEVSHEAVALNVTEGREYLTRKTMAALEYSFRHYQNDVDWFLKADDDVYIIYDNLVKYLSTYNPSKPYYLGSVEYTQKHIPNGYNLGGASYLLSNASASVVVGKGMEKYPALCGGGKVGGAEDVDMADCLQKFNIYPEKTMDSEGRDRFESQNPMRFLKGILGESTDHELEKYRSANYQGKKFGDYADKRIRRMMGNESISFHYVSPAQMYMYDFLVNLHPPKKPLLPSGCSTIQRLQNETVTVGNIDNSQQLLRRQSMTTENSDNSQQVQRLSVKAEDRLWSSEASNATSSEQEPRTSAISSDQNVTTAHRNR